MTRKKIMYLSIFFLLYQFLTIFLAPILIAYFFDETSVYSQLFAQITSFSLPLLFILIISSSNNKRGEYEGLFNLSRFKKPISKNEILISLGLGIVLSLAVKYFYSLIEVLYILSTDDYSIINIIPDLSLMSIIIGIITFVVLPPIFEEMLYRGMYYDTLKEYTPIMQFLIPSLLFALSHAGIFSALSAFFLSIFVVSIMRKKESLLYVILVHLAFNLTAFISSNIVSLPLTTINLLSNYATEGMMWASLLIYVGITILLMQILLYIFKNVNAEASVLSPKEKKKSGYMVLSPLRKYLVFSLMAVFSMIIFIMRVVLA